MHKECINIHPFLSGSSLPGVRAPGNDEYFKKTNIPEKTPLIVRTLKKVSKFLKKM